MEESIQTIMFGTWAAQEAKDWKLVQTGCDRSRDLINLTRKINKSFGWIQPLSYLAYRSYSDSAEYYVRSLEMKVFSYAPELFEGRKVRLNFTPKRAEKTSYDKNPKRYMLIAGRTFMISDTPDLTPRVITGRIYMNGKKVEIRE